MILKRIELENIRSFTKANIDFSTGKTLLTGDIGAGKSTVLMAIEFALFGLLRGELSGPSLLCHDSNEGNVKLTFLLNTKEYTIERTLKRNKESVVQTSGSLIVDGEMQIATATELKSKIIDLLGYPPEMVTKSKSLLYRYTVYTPQEMMKRIIFEDPNARLDTLRALFDVDKYNRISLNATLLSRHLKEEGKRLEGEASDLPELIREKEEHMKNLVEKENELIILKPKVLNAQAQMKGLEEKKKELLERKEKHQRLGKELELLDLQIRGLFEQKIKDETLVKELEQRILDMKENLRELPDIDLIKEKKTEIELGLRTIDNERRTLIRIHSEANAKKHAANETISKMKNLSNCALCLQEVNYEHKNKIILEQTEIVEAQNKIIGENLENQKKGQEQMQILSKDRETFNLLEKEAATITLQHKMIAEKEENKKRILEGLQTYKQKIATLNAKKLDINKERTPLEGTKEDEDQLLLQIENERKKERELSLNQVSLETNIKYIKNLLELNLNKIKIKEKAKETHLKISKKTTWITDTFIPLMNLMEKQVLAKIHTHFNDTFREWFSTLIEDDNLNAKLDDNFSVIIEQNGYICEATQLSGGEKTSLALAYRLALNKIISDLISGIKSKDLLILDEPTDGFSSEQLDKVREVLDQVSAKQILIVSHENKIESFVDHVINVSKGSATPI